jgi:hypothetical protein
MPADAQMLKVGLLIDSMIQPRWVRRVVETIQNSNCARVTLVVRNTTVATPPPSIRRWLSQPEHVLYKVYTRLDDLAFRRECRPDAFERVPIDDLLHGCPILDVKPRRTRFSDFIEGEDLEAIKLATLDVAIRFGFRILRGKILETPRHGVWSYHHGDNRRYRGAPAGFWEVMRGDDVTGSILQILGAELDNGKVIYRSFAPTDKRSVRRNKNNYYWKSSDFVIRKLRDVAEKGVTAMRSNDQEGAFSAYSGPLFKVPRNGEMARMLLGFLSRAVREKLRHLLYRDQWGFAYAIHDAPAPALSPYRFVHVVPPRDRFWADPFPARKGNDHYVFFEELIAGSVHDNKRKAHISAMRVDADGPAGPPFKVLDTACHLSYPYVFEWQGQHYLMPETAGNRTVELYKCEEFPHRWTFVKNLLENVNAVDPTLFFHGGRWWLFASIAIEGSRNVDELHLFHADDPLGPWMPHVRNPVKSDVRSSRPAGRPFEVDGNLYRPAQDCSRRYGYAVVINQVLRLDLAEYEEIEVSRLTPEWRADVTATHTLNRTTDMTVIDASFRIPRWTSGRSRMPVPGWASPPQRVKTAAEEPLRPTSSGAAGRDLEGRRSEAAAVDGVFR